MKLSELVQHRVRGFRVLDLAALVLFLALAVTVYAFKTSAGRERTDIADIEDQIQDESRDVRLLRAKVAGLESAPNVERLATEYANQAPVAPKQEIEPQDLPRIALTGAVNPPATNAPQAATP